MKYNVYQPSLTGNEKKYVDECLDSTWISSKGKFINEFENKFSSYIGTKYASGVCNGTAAIQVAIKALGITKDDEVICPTFTYIASANPIKEAGANVVFVDSLRDTWQLDPEDIKKKITNKTKAIMAVHLYGHPCDIDRIIKIAKEYNLYVIEDCAEAIGSKYQGEKVGSFGDIACFSFFGNKTITCGEGGMVLTNNDYLHERILKIKGQGLAKYREYWHDTLGFNYRMTNIQAAIGLAQLEQIDKFINQKQKIAKWYKGYLNNLPIEFHNASKDVFHTYWMFSILVKNTETRTNLRNFLKENDIETRPTFYPIHTMPIYNDKYEKHEIAEDIALRGINLPSSPNLTEKDVKYICEKIKEFYAK